MNFSLLFLCSQAGNPGKLISNIASDEEFSWFSLCSGTWLIPLATTYLEADDWNYEAK